MVNPLAITKAKLPTSVVVKVVVHEVIVSAAKSTGIPLDTLMVRALVKYLKLDTSLAPPSKTRAPRRPLGDPFWEAQSAKIKELHDSGMSHCKIARVIGVGYSTFLGQVYKRGILPWPVRRGGDKGKLVRQPAP